MKTFKLIFLLSAVTLVFIWGCEREAPVPIDNDEQVSELIAKAGNSGKICKGKSLGPWGVPDGLLHVYGTGPSEAAAQSFPCDFNKPRKVTSVWARLARTGEPEDFYFITIRTDLDGDILAQSIDVDVSDVISEDSIFASGEWVEFPLETPVPLGAGDYFVQMERTGPGDINNYMNWFTDWENPLPDHAGWIRNDEGVWIMYDETFSDEFLITLCYK